MDFDGGDEDGEGGFGDFADVADETVAPEFNVKDSVLFVIDARKAMCERGPGGGPSCFQQSLSCVLKCMEDRILGGERDLVGVLLFGTEKTKVPNGHQSFHHVYVLQELEEPSAASMRTVSLICAGEEAARAEGGGGSSAAAAAATLAAEFGHMEASSPDFDLANALWVTSMLFNSNAAKHTRRRVYLMTNDDNPCASGAAARARALTRSRDLEDANVWIEPFFFSPPPPATFDLGEGSFWRELIGSVRQHYKPGASRPAPAEGGGVGSSESGADGTTPTSSAVFAEDKSDAWLETCIASDPESLLARVRRAAHRKRVLWQSSLSVRDGYAISFEMVSLVRKYSKPTAKKLDARTNEELISQTSMMCTQHGSTLSKQDVFRGYNFGGKWVYFDASELADFGHEDARGGIVPNGLTLLGFKDAEALKIHHNLGAAKFLQPTERAAGSTMAMAALVQAMITKKKIGIARMAKGKVSISRLVALLPQPRVEAGSDAGGGGGGRSLPCGLHLIPLPYAEDIRSVSKPAAMRESDFSSEKLEAARRLVTALQLPSEKNPVGTIPNPATSVHYNYLQVLALNVPGAEVAETIDGTLPDSAWLAHREPEMAAFRKAFELPDIDGAEALAGGPAKRQRTAAPKEEKLSLSGSSPMAEWVAAHMQGRLSTLTNPTLKEFLKEHGLPVGGKKDDLIARVHDFIELTIAQDAAQGEAK